MADITAAGTTSYPSSLDTRSSIQDGVTQRLAAQINGPAAAVVAIENELGTSPSGTAGSVSARLGAALNTDGTVKSSVIVGPQVVYSAGVFTVSSSLSGQCRLTRTNNTTLTLSRYNGAYLLINNVSQLIPQAGVTLTNSGLLASTLYYIYAYMVSTTLTLEASTTSHATDTTSGVEIKSGDPTRTLVGMIYTNGSSAFADSSTQRFVANWYNRKRTSGISTFTATRSGGAGVLTLGEINTEIRVEFLCWADDTVDIRIMGAALNNANGDGAWTAIGVDGSSPEDGATKGTSATAGNPFPAVAAASTGKSEGYHFATLLGAAVTGGTPSWTGSGAAGDRTALYVTVMI